jgi:hypothetical protein
MATGTRTGQGKTTFVEEQLRRITDADEATINEAWKAAGNEGSISDSLVKKTRARLKLTGKRRGTDAGASEAKKAGAGPKGKAGSPKGTKGKTVGKRASGAPSQPNGRATSAAGNGSPRGDRGRLVDEVEAGIDELIFTLKSHGGMSEVEAALRAARRLLTRSAE